MVLRPYGVGKLIGDAQRTPRKARQDRPMRRLAVVIATAASLVAVAPADAASTSSNWAGDAASGAHYSAWYELVPAASVRLRLTVHAGDTISASVSVTGARVRIVLANRTT